MTSELFQHMARGLQNWLWIVGIIHDCFAPFSKPLIFETSFYLKVNFKTEGN
jgi:hypothetical protein